MSITDELTEIPTDKVNYRVASLLKNIFKGTIALLYFTLKCLKFKQNIKYKNLIKKF